MSPSEFEEKLTARAAAADLVLRPELTDRLHSYYQLLAHWNRKINLTAINLHELPPEAIDRLFIEPIAAARYAELARRVIDIGSGGGSPAIPFALAAEAASLTMVESKSRKSVFLQEAARAVALPARVLTARFEEAVEQPEFESAFEAVTVRAVRVDETAVKRLSQFLSATGSLFLFQTPELVPPEGMTVEPRALTANSRLQLVRRCEMFHGEQHT